MKRVLTAETAVFVHFQTVGRILFVLHGVIVALLALVASECDLYSHFGTSLSFIPCGTVASLNEERAWLDRPLP